MEEKSMNLYEKLIEVRKSCPYLKKDNKGYQFTYVSSSQTLGSLKEKMDELGVLLIPSVLAFETKDHTTKKGDHQYFTILDMSFTWVNAEKPEEQIVSKWTGQGLDDGEKGVGKALTYAEKYFMLKFFNIATDKDDPDSFQKRSGSTKQTPKNEILSIYKEGLKALEHFGIKEAEIFDKLGKKKKDLTMEDIVKMRGYYEQIQGGVPPAHVFPLPEEKLPTESLKTGNEVWGFDETPKKENEITIYLNQCTTYKKNLGEEIYYTTIADLGFAKANEAKSKKDWDRVLTALEAEMKKKKTAVKKSVKCPNNGDMIFVDHCNSKCGVREDCPAFPDDNLLE